MPQFTIYHNPRCRKSRETLEILQQHTNNIRIILYLKEALLKQQIAELHSQLALPITTMLRLNEIEYKQHFGRIEQMSDADIYQNICDFPKVLERPIVSDGKTAIIGRPPANVLAFFDK